MPKLQNFFVEFANGNGVFFGGDVVQGRVVVMLNEPMKMRNVRILFKGSAENRWTETRHTGTGDNRRTEHIHYHAEEIYCNQELILWGGAETGTMEAGSFQFPFQFPLPPLCPTSFEGTSGHIRYSAKATIDKPWNFDHTTKSVITVLGVQDLNVDPNARRPIQAQNQKTLGWACCKSGDISVTVKVAKMGFVPGETIFAHIDATNNSGRKIKRMEIKEWKLKVVQLSRYDAYRGMSHVSRVGGGDLMGNHSGFHGGFHKTRHSDRVLLERVYEEEIPEGSSRQWNNEQLLLPPCPDMLLACSIIHIDYILRIKIVPSGMSTSLELEAPFIVGNKPLIDAYAFNPSFNPNPGMGPSAPSADPNSVNPPYPEAPPPTYEESVFGKSNIRDANDNDHTRGEAEFAPLYPSFPFPQPSAPPMPMPN